MLRAEKLILKKCQFELCLYTPNDILELILFNYFTKEISDNIKDILETLVQFTLGEYLIYGKYDFLTITISCFYFGIFNCESLTENIKKESQKQFKIFLEEIPFVNKEKIKECLNDIINIINIEENEDNSNNEADDSFNENCFTRTNSTTSLNDIFISFDKNSDNSSSVKYSEVKKDINFLGKKRDII